MRNINELNPWLFRELLHGGEYAIRVESEADIQALAKRLGYSYARCYCDFNDYQVYELLYDEPHMYSTSPEMLFIQYKYARLDKEGEIQELQKAVYNHLEFPETTGSNQPHMRSAMLPPGKPLADEIISFRTRVADRLNDFKERRHRRRDDQDDDWIDDGWDDYEEET